MPRWSNSDAGDGQIWESGGVRLQVGAIVDGQYLKRNGATIDSAAVAAGGDVSGPGGAVVQDVIVSWDVAAASPYTVNETDLLHVSDAATYSGITSTLVNGDLILAPNGTGAVQAQIADGGVGGGNARGSNAVDFQMTRAAATQVASGQNAFLAGASNSTASGDRSAVIAASGAATNTFSAVIAGTGTASGTYSAVIAGYDSSVASGSYSGVFAGRRLTASGTQSVVLGGQFATAAGTATAVVASDACSVNNTSGNSAVLASYNSVITAGTRSIIAGSYYADASSCSYATVLSSYWGLATANFTLATGLAPLADHPCSVVWSGNSRPTSIVGDIYRGESQGQLVHLDVRIDDSGGGGPTTSPIATGSTEFSVPTNGTVSITGTVVCWNETDETATSWAVDVLATNPAGNAVLAGGGGVQTIKHTNDAGVPVLTIAVSGADAIVGFDATGINSKITRWSASLFMARATT